MNHRVRNSLTALAPYLGLIGVFAFFALSPEAKGFVSALNFRNVCAQTVVVALAALGMTFVIIGRGIDLSVGSVMALASVIAALLVDSGVPTLIAVVGGCATGCLCGYINGKLITGLRIAPFIATLGMYGVARGMAKFLAENQTVRPDEATWIYGAMARSPGFYPDGWPEALRLAPAVWLLAVLAVVMSVVLRKTVFGVHTFAVGSNEAAARLCGVRVARNKVQVYALAGVFAGLAGVFQFGYLEMGDPTTLVGAELKVIAAVVIGGASLSGGEGRISGALVGAALMAILENGLTLSGVPNYVQDILIGLIIVVAVALDSLRHRK